MKLPNNSGILLMGFVVTTSVIVYWKCVDNANLWIHTNT
jgi:hypothetical protein